MLFFITDKMFCGLIKRLRGPNEITLPAGYSPQAVVWRPLI